MTSRPGVVLVTFGTSGDVNPFIALARALRRAGRTVRFLTDPHHAPSARAAGLDARTFESGVGPDLFARDPLLLDPKRGGVRYLTRCVPPAAPALYDATRAAIEDLRAPAAPAPLVLAHHTAWAAAWAAQTAEAPWGVAAVAPTSWPSARDGNMYPGMPDLDRYPAWMMRLGNAIGARAVDRAVDPAANRARAELGLPPLRRVMTRRMLEGAINIGMWPPWWRPPAPDDPPRAHIVGWPLWDGPARADPDALERVAAFLDAGEPPVLFTLGTLAGQAGVGFASTAAHAARTARVRALALLGRGADHEPDADDDPARVMKLNGYVPYGELMPRCAAIVHHAGMGTLARVTAAGVPAVATPVVLDQFDNARRARVLGASATVPFARLTPDRLARAIRSVMTDRDRARARELASRVAGDVDAQLENALAAVFGDQ